MRYTGLRGCAIILLSLMVVIGGCNKCDNNDKDYYESSNRRNIDVSGDTVDKDKNSERDGERDSSDKILTDTSLTEFQKFAVKFEESDFKYEATIGKIHDINRRDRVDSVYVEKFLRGE